MTTSGNDAVRIVRDLRPFYYLDFCAPCNLDCFYCYEDRRRVDTGAVRRAILRGLDLAHRAGYRTVVFESGELLLLPFWREVVERATALAFDERILISNLTLLDEDSVRALEAAGLTAVAGTIFGFDEQATRQVAGRDGVFARQMRGIQSVLARPGLTFVPHLMLTRAVAEDPLRCVARCAGLIGRPLSAVVLSAIEPVAGSGAAEHPCFTDALTLDWPELLGQLQKEGVFSVVQNLPACRLGRFAQRNYLIRKRVGRILQGWPEDEQLALEVNRIESLYGRLPPQGPCAPCAALAVCQRFVEYGPTLPGADFDDEAVVRQLFAEEGVEADVRRTVDLLRRIESEPASEYKLDP